MKGSDSNEVWTWDFLAAVFLLGAGKHTGFIPGWLASGLLTLLAVVSVAALVIKMTSGLPDNDSEEGDGK